MSSYQPTYKRYNEQAILIEWPTDINTRILSEVLRYKEKIELVLNQEVSEVRSAYQSLLIIYKSYVTDVSGAIDVLKAVYTSDVELKPLTSKIWKVPVCYDDRFGWDLEEMSLSKKISKGRIIKLHSEVIYTVYFIGFLPGFLYLGGLNEMLFTPRKATPRMNIRKGAVAIGGSQTGIYPNDSPAGWHIIGNSPIDFFNPKASLPCFAKAGDRIQFIPISLKEYASIEKLIEEGDYYLDSEVWHD